MWDLWKTQYRDNLLLWNKQTNMDGHWNQRIWSKCTLFHKFSVTYSFRFQVSYLKSGYKFLSSNTHGKYRFPFHKLLSEISWNTIRITTFPACNRHSPRICVSKYEAKPLLPPTNDWVILLLGISSYLNTPAEAHTFLLCGSSWLLHFLILGMNLEATFDDLKSKTMKDQPDQKPNGEKAKGTRDGECV